MAFCTNCGQQLTDTQRFCPECGTPVPVKAAPQNTPVAAPPAAAEPAVIEEPVAAAPVVPAVEEPVVIEEPVAEETPIEPPVQRPAMRNVFEAPKPKAAPQMKNVFVTPPKKEKQASKMQDVFVQTAAKKPLNKRLFLFGGIALAVILVLVLCLTTCGGKEPTVADPNLGLYNAVTAKAFGLEMSVTDLWENGFSVELLDKGKCKLNVDGTKANGKWTLDGTAFTVKGGGFSGEGTLFEGVLILENVLDQGIDLTFELEGGYNPVPAASAEEGNKGGKKKDDSADIFGVYEAQLAVSQGFQMDIETIWTDGFSIELRKKDKCAIVMNGIETLGDYTLDGEKIHVKGSAIDSDGTLKDGVLVLEDVFGTGMSVTLCKEGVELPADAGPYAHWAGDWYGWWVISSAYGAYAEGEGNFWDACAKIEVNGENGTITVWDEDGEFTSSTVTFRGGVTDKGCFVSEEGYFWDAPIGHADWNFDPGASIVSAIPDMLLIEARYVDPEDEDSYFDYQIFLRPWGMKWDDIASMDPSVMPYDDMMPGMYADWYLPLVEAGASMPASFDAEAEISAASQTAALHPNEPSSSGNGKFANEKDFYRFAKWLLDMDSSYRQYCTYDFVVDYCGVEGKDDGNKGANSMTDLGDHYFLWSSPDGKKTIYAGFRGREDGSWLLANMNTSGFATTDIPKDIKVSYPTPDGVAANGNGGKHSDTIDCFMTDVKTTVTLNVPDAGWYYKADTSNIRVFNVPSEKEQKSNSPVIKFGCQSSLDRINFYLDMFENLKEIGTRTIGGIEMQGRTYKYIGMEWTEYYAELPSGVWLSISISGIDIDAGSEGGSILDSVKLS